MSEQLTIKPNQLQEEEKQQPPKNCSQQLGQAACIDCVAAPNCPILKLKQAQTEQVTAPDNYSYTNDLLSDKNNLIIAGFKPKEEPKLAPKKPPKPKNQPKKQINQHNKVPKKPAAQSALLIALGALEDMAKKSITKNK